MNGTINSLEVDGKVYGQFHRETAPVVDKEQDWCWLSKRDLKVETEAFLCAPQGQPLRTNYVKYHNDKTSESPLCRMCGKRGESVHHIASE